jgi:hypothetical protein
MARVVHFEIHASRPDRLIAFYSSLFGWKFQQWDASEYWLIETGAAQAPGINGGLLVRRGPAPVDGQPVNSFVCTVEVAGLEETLARAGSLQGSVAVPTMPIPGVGWLAYIKDPDGNILGVMQPDASAK